MKLETSRFLDAEMDRAICEISKLNYSQESTIVLIADRMQIAYEKARKMEENHA